MINHDEFHSIWETVLLEFKFLEIKYLQKNIIRALLIHRETMFQSQLEERERSLTGICDLSLAAIKMQTEALSFRSTLSLNSSWLFLFLSSFS